MSVGLVSKTLNFVKSTRPFIPYHNSRSVLCGCYQRVSFSSKTTKNVSFERNPETGEIKKKKTPILPKITLLHGNEIDITTVEEAQKIAKRRDLKLVKIIDIDTKTQRPIYKLMTGTEYHQEDLKQRERRKLEKQKTGFKGEKVLMIGQNISEHDLEVHINKIMKWLEKNYEVRVVINGDKDNIKKAENIYLFMENHLRNHGRVIQVRQKGSDVKFQVLPPKTPKNGNKEDNEIVL